MTPKGDHIIQFQLSLIIMLYFGIIIFRLWDPKIEEKIVQDKIGMNLLYVQVRMYGITVLMERDFWVIYIRCVHCRV